jgi:hypothetical protein
MIELSHQASMLFKETPKPEKKIFGRNGAEILCSERKKELVFISKIIILRLKAGYQKKIRNLIPTRKGFIWCIFRVFRMKISLKF